MSRYPKIDSDYEFKGFCLNWEEDVFPKCPNKDGSIIDGSRDIHDITIKLGNSMKGTNFQYVLCTGPTIGNPNHSSKETVYILAK